ncbi:NB-ARC domain-containing protein [Streptomyces coeruleorubidus]|uniref:NB-ARC domain-containing protein n=1 Tax=Streptomyces coeruleorubidus TaxID=116188 RepID=UPI00237F289F|nr:NB-ARC domain-containing protein [Streptomyces coeruleorubidus]WDV56550.1 NB-ARC domain-containing protein [Streptomyces coeruleorubidus]
MPQVLDPGKARTMDEFIAELRLLKAWAGNPSITEITRRVHRDWQQAGRPRGEWPARSTVGNCFQVGRRRPNSDLLMAVVQALVGADEAIVSLWRQSLRTVLGEAEAAARVSAYDRLPTGLSAFVGRQGLVARAETLLSPGRGATTVALEGMAGIGKTSLALHLAHGLLAGKRNDTPVLFANLRGSVPQGPPADPATVLETFLRLLGTTGDRIPYDLDARAALYRRQLAGTDVLIVLDDAADAAQLRSLLPGTAGSRTLITSRRALTGLDEATRLPVPLFDPDESLELLRATAGAERITPDVPAARQIADLLGHLPLALSTIGRHMQGHPAWTLDDYYREPVISLALEDGVRTALSASDAQLPQGAQRLLRMLALHPLQEIDGGTAAALLGEPRAVAEYHLATLAAAHLLERSAPSRFRLHPLTHAYAEERICIDEPASLIRQALGRLLDHGRSSDTAMRSDSRTTRGLRPPMPWQHAGADGEIRVPQQSRAGRVLAA